MSKFLTSAQITNIHLANLLVLIMIYLEAVIDNF